MVRIAIAAAFDAICGTLPVGSVAFEVEANERGERYVWLEEGWVNKLRAESVQVVSRAGRSAGSYPQALK
jgi:hypothetical protein